jgi:hypothetical protein
MLNLLDQHALEIRNGLPTVCPSILVADAACLSHFWIREGQVIWDEQWSKTKVDRVMAAQLKRHMAGNRESQTLWEKFARWVRSLTRT